MDIKRNVLGRSRIIVGLNCRRLHYNATTTKGNNLNTGNLSPYLNYSVMRYSPISVSYHLITFLIFLIIASGCRPANNTRYIEFIIRDNNSNPAAFNSKSAHIKYITLMPENIYGLFTNIAVVYSLTADTLLTELIQRGTALHEGLSVGGLYIQNNTLSFIWVYDITLGKLFKINIQQAIKDTNYLPENEANLTGELKNLVSPEIVNDSLILATTYSIDDCRYFYTNTNKILKKAGTLPEVINSELLYDPPATKFPNKAYIFKATGIRHPSENKVAVFYNKTDRAEFYSNDSLIKIVTGQDTFGPKMQVTKLKTGFSIEEYDKTRFAYLSMAYTQDFIYGLCAGREAGETCSNRIVVFDWNGRFIYELSVDKAICKICIEPKRKILYCYENIEHGVFSIDLNLIK